METPDHEWKQGWKPSNRPQSTLAKNFMSELDSLFKLDGDLDTLDKTVHQKKQAVTTQTQELEALEARLRAAEDRLKQASGTSPPRQQDTQRPTEGSLPAHDKARADGPSSPLAQKNAERPSSSVPVEAEKA